jgi:hypothetical protein
VQRVDEVDRILLHVANIIYKICMLMAFAAVIYKTVTGKGKSQRSSRRQFMSQTHTLTSIDDALSDWWSAYKRPCVIVLSRRSVHVKGKVTALLFLSFAKLQRYEHK